MNVEPQLDPPAELTVSVEAAEFQRMLYLGLPIRLRDSVAGRWLLCAHEYNELHVGDEDRRMACRAGLLAELASICATCEVSRKETPS